MQGACRWNEHLRWAAVVPATTLALVKVERVVDCATLPVSFNPFGAEADPPWLPQTGHRLPEAGRATEGV